MPASELSICVCDKGNRKLGKALPMRPIIIKLLMFVRVMNFRFLIDIGRKQIHVINTLSPAICKGVNDFRPSFIRIYDDPQVTASSTSTEAYRVSLRFSMEIAKIIEFIIFAGLKGR
jgi:hypothetical protein